MEITHLGHAAVLLEVGDRRILFDPGTFSDAWHDLSGLDAILVTHRHPDHIDPAAFPGLLDANPDAAVYVEPGVLEHYRLPERCRPIAADVEVALGGVTVAAVGGLHAVIHRDIPRIGNVGLVVTAEGEPTFFHPGDCLTAIPREVDVLAVPAYGPWAALKETLDFVREVGASWGFPIHEGLLSERGWVVAFDRLHQMTDTAMVDLRGGLPWTPVTR